MITKEAKIVVIGAENGNLLLENDVMKLVKNAGTHHMYIIVDETPSGKDNAIDYNGVYHKVIATTDENLALPSPSVRFLKKFVSLHNAGKVIDTIFVEYVPIYMPFNPYKDDQSLDKEYGELIAYLNNPVYIPKVNPKNNTIVIRKKVNDIPKDVLKDLLLRFAESYAVRLFEGDYTKDPILFKSLPDFVGNWVEEEL